MEDAYIIRFAQEARTDIENLYYYIADECSSPAGADKYIDGIYTIIATLTKSPTSHPINIREHLQTYYGPNARTAHYKKMSIVYNIIGCEVLIRRVMASSLIL
jgi:plasmid stabilization system protein ParE